MGEHFFPSFVLAFLAHALCDQGRYDEAASALERAKGLAQPEDQWMETLRTSADARLLAVRGETEAALARGREALAVAAEVESPELRAQALVAVAEVWRRAHRPPEEGAALREALDLYEHKGIRPAADRVRARIAEFDTVSAS